MKNLLIAATAIALVGCGKSKDYTINGNITGIGDGQVYLMTYSEAGVVPVDTTDVKSGKFKFTGDLSKPELYYISYSENPELYTPVFIEKGVIEVTGELNNADAPVEATGTPSNDAYNVYVETMKPMMEKYYAVMDELQQAQIADNQPVVDSINAVISAWQADVKNKQKDIISANSKLPFGAMVAYEAAMSESTPEGVTANLVLLDTVLSGNVFVKQMNKLVTSMGFVVVGQPAPDFTLPDPQGKMISLSSLRGKYVIIDFWASWCMPCRNANPHMVSLFKTYGGKGLNIIGVSLDRDKAAWIKAIADDSLTWPQVYADGSDVTELYGVEAIPYTVLIDKDGAIIAKNPITSELDAKLKELLAK